MLGLSADLEDHFSRELWVQSRLPDPRGPRGSPCWVLPGGPWVLFGSRATKPLLWGLTWGHTIKSVHRVPSGCWGRVEGPECHKGIKELTGGGHRDSREKLGAARWQDQVLGRSVGAMEVREGLEDLGGPANLERGPGATRQGDGRPGPAPGPAPARGGPAGLLPALPVPAGNTVDW